MEGVDLCAYEKQVSCYNAIFLTFGNPAREFGLTFEPAVLFIDR